MFINKLPWSLQKVYGYFVSERIGPPCRQFPQIGVRNTANSLSKVKLCSLLVVCKMSLQLIAESVWNSGSLAQQRPLTCSKDTKSGVALC